jgi:serine protease Do
MRSSAGWVAGGVVLVLAGLILGVLITANYAWSPPSAAQDQAETHYDQAQRVYEAARRGESPFVAVAEEVLPAVVSVDTKRTISGRGQDPMREMFREFFGERMFREYYGDEDQPQEYEIPSSGSGFIFDDRGYVMTNNHVVSEADKIEITLSDGRVFDGEIVGLDPATDIAVVKIEGRDLPTARVGDSDKIRVGDWAIAIGNPLELKGTVTVGVISAVGRVDLNIRGRAPLYQDFIQTDASINFGNSGGPLVNIDGEVVGVNSAISPAANGIGFAIPINLARSVADALVEDGKVVRGYLGIVPQEITRALAEAKNLDGTEGVIIASVESGTPADEAGLEPGDVILRFAGAKIADVAQFRMAVASVRPGEDVDVTILRDGKRRELTARLAERPDAFAGVGPGEVEEKETKWLGIEVVDLDDAAAREFQVEADEGCLVVDVERGSPAAEGGLLVGDVVVGVGDRKVKGLRDYREIMKDLEGRDRAIAFMVQRGAYTYFVAIRPE